MKYSWPSCSPDCSVCKAIEAERQRIEENQLNTTIPTTGITADLSSIDDMALEIENTVQRTRNAYLSKRDAYEARIAELEKELKDEHELGVQMFNSEETLLNAAYDDQRDFRKIVAELRAELVRERETGNALSKQVVKYYQMIEDERAARREVEDDLQSLMDEAEAEISGLQDEVMAMSQVADGLLSLLALR